jgi:hypothetical protein
MKKLQRARPFIKPIAVSDSDRYLILIQWTGDISRRPHLRVFKSVTHEIRYHRIGLFQVVKVFTFLKVEGG